MPSIKTEKQQDSVSPADQTKLKKVEPVPTHSHWKAMVHGSPQSSNQVFQKLLNVPQTLISSCEINKLGFLRQAPSINLGIRMSTAPCKRIVQSPNVRNHMLGHTLNLGLCDVWRLSFSSVASNEENQGCIQLKVAGVSRKYVNGYLTGTLGSASIGYPMQKPRRIKLWFRDQS
uniref:Uncharacterized protein n=1 Tax=Coccidioides posadasii RMSCC 3488 TaxID=454284 RepID=A0A0J6F554_COCPO|nr:hypothetical protein CPAG_00446 [Coccidioides posadasii RMSCC 3488]